MSSPKHIVAFAYQGWGHARPLTNLIARMVKLRPVTVTFLTTDLFFERCKTELSRSFEPGDEEIAQRVKIISIGNIAFFTFVKGDTMFADAWKSLIEKGELVCTQSGARHSGIPKPQAVILDFFARNEFLSIKALTGNSVKVIAWFPGLVYALFHLFGPKSLGGVGSIHLAAEEEALRTGRAYDDIVKEIAIQDKGAVVRIPAMPPMYDYEYYPQDFPIPDEAFLTMFPGVYQTLEEVDGILLFTPESYEPGAVEAVRGWFGETGRPAYVCGPLLPSASKATAAENEKKLSNESAEIQAFLDETLAQSGEKSLLYIRKRRLVYIDLVMQIVYWGLAEGREILRALDRARKISFGSTFWPVKTPEKMWAFLDVVMELNIPFILSHASPFAVIPEDVKEKVKAYGKGVLSPWTPQQLILDHPATGWFVAHGGQGGVTEAISAGVPQILWPFTADQPLNAIHLSTNLGIGYELLEVRTGHGLKPIYRTGHTPLGTPDALRAEARAVLQDAFFGADGAKKRTKLDVLRQAVLGEWEDEGASKRDVTLFLDSLL